MEILVLKTNINSRNDFHLVRNKLKTHYKIRQCTIDLEDVDKVVRLVGYKIGVNDVVTRINSLGFNCEELPA